MLLQTNSYVVPKDRRAEHARLLRRFRQTLARLGCDQFEVYEQAGQNWGTGDTSGRFVQIMKFRDRRHQLAVQAGERSDPQAQQLIAEFCELINFPYQQENGLFAVGFYNSALPVGPARASATKHSEEEGPVEHEEITAAQAVAATAAEVAPPDQQTYVAATPTAAEFSGEPVPASQVPGTEPAAESVEEHRDEAAAPIESAPPVEAEIATPQHVSEDAAAPEHPDAFRDEMEALGAAIDDEPMTAVADLPDSGAEPHPLDVELSGDLEEQPSAGEPEPVSHAASGNGELVSGNGAEPHHEFDEVDTVLADEIGHPKAGEGHGAFDSLLDEPFEPESARNDSDHTKDPAAELPSEATGSGIGAVLDGLDDADLDIALPAELIEDDLEPHAPDAHRQGGHGNERG